MSRLGFVLLGALTLAGCGSKDEARVRWDLSVANTTGEPFAVRMRLDGAQVFQQAVPAAAHSATLEGSYALREHVVEFEILSPARPVATYVGTVEYRIESEGRAAIVDGVPTALQAGETLRVVVSLEAESAP